MSSSISDNVLRIRDRIARAAESSGRSEQDVRLIAVTKYVGPEEIEALLAAGCYDLGESRPQSLWDRAELFRERGIRWHFIGHLQRNKVRRTLPLVELFHSADSLRLLAAMNEEAAAIGRTLEVLLEVNISGEPSKTGFAPAELEAALPEVLTFERLQLRGLMGMAALEGDLNVARKNFSQLRILRDRLQSSAPAGVTLPELSMGMSGDFEAAIAEGATMVRIGSALFE